MKVLARPVEMITVTSAAGEPTPIRFRSAVLRYGEAWNLKVYEVHI